MKIEELTDQFVRASRRVKLFRDTMPLPCQGCERQFATRSERSRHCIVVHNARFWKKVGLQHIQSKQAGRSLPREVQSADLASGQETIASMSDPEIISDEHRDDGDFQADLD